MLTNGSRMDSRLHTGQEVNENSEPWMSFSSRGSDGEFINNDRFSMLLMMTIATRRRVEYQEDLICINCLHSGHDHHALM